MTRNPTSLDNGQHASIPAERTFGCTYWLITGKICWIFDFNNTWFNQKVCIRFFFGLELGDKNGAPLGIHVDWNDEVIAGKELGIKFGVIKLSVEGGIVGLALGYAYRTPIGSYSNWNDWFIFSKYLWPTIGNIMGLNLEWYEGLLLGIYAVSRYF